MRRFLIGLAAGGALLLVAGITFVTVFSGPELSVQISAADVIFAGKPFRVQLLISNPHDEAVTLDHIDIDDSVFDTFRVISVTKDPDWRDTRFDMIGKESWWFVTVMQPAQRETVEFELIGESAGLFQLGFDVCNAFQDCSRNLLTVQMLSPTHD